MDAGDQSSASDRVSDSSRANGDAAVSRLLEEERTGAVVRAGKHIESLVWALEGSTEWILCQAAAEVARGNPRQAIDLYLPLLRQEPHHPQLINRLADALAAAGQTDQALRHFFALAQMLEADLRPRRALAIYCKILRLYPSNPRAEREASRLRESLDRSSSGPHQSDT